MLLVKKSKFISNTTTYIDDDAASIATLPCSPALEEIYEPKVYWGRYSNPFEKDTVQKHECNTDQATSLCLEHVPIPHTKYNQCKRRGISARPNVNNKQKCLETTRQLASPGLQSASKHTITQTGRISKPPARYSSFWSKVDISTQSARISKPPARYSTPWSGVVISTRSGRISNPPLRYGTSWSKVI